MKYSLKFVVTTTVLCLSIMAATIPRSVIAQVPATNPAQPNATMELSGQWRFAMDRDDVGVKEQWFNRELTDRINLPGILQSQGYGDEIGIDTPWVAGLPRDLRWYLLPQYKAYTQPGNVKIPFLSQPPKHYLGVAWYQRDVDIPQAWQDKRVQLFLERPRWETTAWIDDRKIGSCNSLVAPHEYELGILPPGKHRISIRDDNRMILPYRPDGHSVSDALGATWNGIAGRIELIATSPVWIDDAQVFPNVADKKALIKVHIGNITGRAGSGTLTAGAATKEVEWDEKGAQVELETALQAGAQTWDEFHPTLQHLTLKLADEKADDQRQISFGLREIKAEGVKIMLNGREINFRGTHHGGDFPLTGYPATDVDSWKKIIQTCKDYGLNHIRFHSWCPPDAAFTASDELGFYIQPECGMWNSFTPGNVISKMLELETARIERAYGNHPSFVLLSPSNEPAGRWQGVLEPWTVNWYKQDPRRLYAENTGRANPRADGPQYAIFAVRGNRGWFGADYSAMLSGVKVPVLSHEVGQWCAYPDFDVIQEFTGYLRPGNYEIFRDSAAQHGVLDRNKDFAWASGKFQLACYKEEIEANLRTPGLAGFQLLDLRDYLGQGTALIGVVDAFWKPKSYVSARQFSRFCGPTVPLARMRNHVFRNSDTFDVDVEIAHYGPSPLSGAAPYWRIVDLTGKTAIEGTFPARDIPIGKNINLGKITVDLHQLTAPKQYKLVVGLADTSVENDWNFWLYPAEVDATVPADVLVTGIWGDAKNRLATGGKVLFTPAATDLDDTCPPLNNVPVFWNRQMNPKHEAMLGLWCDVKHPALAGYPTEAFCDWQWTDIVRGVRAINVEKVPPQLQPIVSAIDDWNRNYKLGVVFECKVGPGRLLVCAPDIQNNLENRSVARQLRRSLLDYMAGEQFQPPVTLTVQEADALWLGSNARNSELAPVAPPQDINEGPNTPSVVR
ncbi:MAG: sugar-binding domain-containing protein [Thermoguttaceae bacterium]